MDIIITTAAQLKELIKECLQDIQPVSEPKLIEQTSKNLYSIKELADFLGCSTVTAQKLKNSGKIRFKQFGRKVFFNTTEVLEDIKKNSANRRREVCHD